MMNFPLFIKSKEPLTQDYIVKKLSELRTHSSSPLSHYQVAAIVEVQLAGYFFYMSGVNVEMTDHNRLSIHGEQNALISALTVLGGDIKFSKIWIMAAPAYASSINPPNAGKACGHCRQIMMSLAEPHAEIYAVKLNGEILPPDTFEAGFLVGSFSEQDLDLGADKQFLRSCEARNLELLDLLNKTELLPTTTIVKLLNNMLPHIISNGFLTSPIQACILTCKDKGYAVGVLAQDIAFLTTDAVFAALGNAISRFSDKELYIDAIYLLSINSSMAQFSSAEIEALSRYVTASTPVYVCTKHTPISTGKFINYKNARDAIIASNLMKTELSQE